MGLCSSSPTAEGGSKKNKAPALTIPPNYIPAITAAPLFRQVQEGAQLNHLACYFTHKVFPPGTVVSEMGSSKQILYLIAEGTAIVYVDNGGKKKGTETKLAELKANDYFGEISLVRENTLTSASIKAGPRPLSLLLLTHEHWNELDDQPWYRACNQRLRLTANHRFSKKLKSINFLANVPDSSLDVLGGLFRLKTYQTGNVILAEGDAALCIVVDLDLPEGDAIPLEGLPAVAGVRGVLEDAHLHWRDLRFAARGRRWCGPLFEGDLAHFRYFGRRPGRH